MQTLRKKTSPLKYKNETSRFLGEGVSFKAKLIGILEVSEARGDRMCQEALSDLKMAIRAAGEHKQRITINIAIDGLRLRDEKTGDSLYHHPVHKISFIAQDMSDSRAFGYIFGSPDTGHRFFGIKTDKAASQVVIAMRDLFQVVFALKKKEIELAKQHLDKSRYSTSPLFSERGLLSSKNESSSSSKGGNLDSKSGANSSESRSMPAVADLVDLELELNSLQQGLTQMERITPSDPFGSKDDPFGDSFTTFPNPILPPPPSGRERASRTSESSSIFSPKTLHSNPSIISTSSADLFGGSRDLNTPKDLSLNEFNSSHDEPSSGDWFTPPAGNSLFEDTPLTSLDTNINQHEIAKQEILSQFDVFTELDPLGTENFRTNIGTGKLKPYVDKKHFFQELKNPPKKVLNDLVSESQPQEASLFTATFEHFEQKTLLKSPNNIYNNDPFGEDPFDQTDPFADSDFNKDVFDDLNEFKTFSSQNKLNDLSSTNDLLFGSNKILNGSNKRLFENPSLDMSSESECAPDPPPRPASSLNQIKPPPLPPKKQPGDLTIRPPPRPPPSEESHYEYIDKFEVKFVANFETSPPLPVPARKSKFESDFVQEEEDYLTPVQSVKNKPILLPPPKSRKKQQESNPIEGLDIILSQLTLKGLNDLASKLNIPPSQLSNMTLVQLTSYLSNFIKNTQNSSEEQQSVPPRTDFADFNYFNKSSNAASETNYDRYAVFRELLQEDLKQTKIDCEPQEIIEETKPVLTSLEIQAEDKYAALREIAEFELKSLENINEESSVLNEDLEDKTNLEDLESLKEELDEMTLEHNIINTSKENDLNKTSMNIMDNIEMENLKASDENVADFNTIVEIRTQSPEKECLAVEDPIKENIHAPSGSLSDIVSGSSPDVELTASNSENAKKISNISGESWAVFDQTNLVSESPKEVKTTQSEEGVSPWSSDSKEFGNGSPPDWKEGTTPDNWSSTARSRPPTWWDATGEPQPYHASNRRSTDSYDDDCYEFYDRPRRRRQPAWSGQVTGGQSSSSRDVSPWEEEPRRRENRQTSWTSRHHRQHSFERHRDRRHTDSWDEEDDFEYEDEHSRFHYPEKRISREPERHIGASRDIDEWEDRRVPHRRHREVEHEKWCCPDYDIAEPEKHSSRYGNVRWAERRKNEDRYYARESQDSPWEDEYNNVPEEHHPHYVTTRRTRIRPSSASEMDRKTGEIKMRGGQHYFGGSDGERDRRYKQGRRSKSKDSQYSEPVYSRHKIDPGLTLRNPHRIKHQKFQFENDFEQNTPPKKPEHIKEPKKAISITRKKSKESPKTEEISTFPRAKASMFENDFVPSESESPNSGRLAARFSFDNDFESSEMESPTVKTGNRVRYEKTWFEGDARRNKARYKQKSLFEDDFSPTEKVEVEEGIPSIKEELGNEEESVSDTGRNGNVNYRKSMTKIGRNDGHLKKSDSVNIFARESDPFDDDFFCGNSNGTGDGSRGEVKWTKQFSDFDIQRAK